MRLLDRTADCGNRTVSRALCASLTLVFDNFEGKKVFADACRTLLIYDMGDVFVPEKVKC